MFINAINNHVSYIQKHQAAKVNMFLVDCDLQWEIIPMERMHINLVDEIGERCGMFTVDKLVINYTASSNNNEAVTFTFYQDSEEQVGLDSIAVIRRLTKSFNLCWDFDQELAAHNSESCREFMNSRIVYVFPTF